MGLGTQDKATKSHFVCHEGTTGAMLNKETGLKITSMISGPMGGDQQLGALISEGKIDILIFFGIHLMPFRMIPTSRHC